MHTDPLINGTEQEKLAEIMRVFVQARAELARQEKQKLDQRIEDYLQWGCRA